MRRLSHFGCSVSVAFQCLLCQDRQRTAWAGLDEQNEAFLSVL